MSAPETIDSRTHRVLAGVSRVAVLEALRVNAGLLDVQAIAEQVGLHPNTVRSHLDQLGEAGLVESEVQERKTPGRPRLLFRATWTRGAGAEGSYKVLAEVLASGIRDGEPAPGALAAEAGRRWGQRLERQGGASADKLDSGHALDRLVALLDDVGFAPQLSKATGATTAIGATAATAATAKATVIELHQCPFYDIAREHTDVVCAVHLGLIQGALDQMQAPPATVGLEPFVRPDLCLVRITSAVVDGPGARV
jgi:predicted ArsR family transcriptional regulator